MSKTPPPRKAASSPLAATLLSRALKKVGEKDGDLSAQLAAAKLQNKYGKK